MSALPLNEDTLSEKPAIAQLKAMGCLFIPGEKLDPQETDDSERTSRREVVLTERLRRKLEELNPRATEETLDKAVRFMTSFQAAGLLEENQSIHEALVQYKSFEQDSDKGRRSQTIKFIDFENPEANEYLAVNQFWVKGPKDLNRPDIVIFVNGIPLAVIECKSPVAKDVGVVDAARQLIRYQSEIPALFRTNQLLLGVNVFGAQYAVVGAPLEHFHEWHAPTKEKMPQLDLHPAILEMRELGLMEKGDLPPIPAAQDVLIAALLNKRNLLDIIRNFTVFDSNEFCRRVKKVCRYQQFTAAQKIVKRVLEEKDKKGIVWHWQGSGKSLTMLFTALKLKREEERLKNPFIVIVTDRKDLDGQIEGNFLRCGFPNPERAKTSHDLYEMLSGPTGRTIMTTVQKFKTTLDEPLSTATNIIVLTDEAHRTQYGNLAFNLRKALPNAAFFAFTGTPLDKRNRSTYKLFSPPNETYLDRYSIQESERDKTTRPIKYVSRMAQLHVVGGSLDAMLRHLFPGMSKAELLEVKKKHATIDTLAGSPRRIERVALDILEHYNQSIRPNGTKAIIVASDRASAVEYKNALDRILNPEASKVVMTLNPDKDPKEWKEKYDLTDEQEKEIKERFKNPNNGLVFLIVCDKLLTGFDAPILQVIYLDQRLREHTLLQAVARTNRPLEGKHYGLVVDYVGIGKELAEAIAMFSREDLQGLFSVDDVDRELGNLKKAHRESMGFFSGVLKRGLNPKEQVQECVAALQDETERGKFNDAFLAFARSLDFLMPDLRVEPYLKDFKFLGLLRAGLKNLYRDHALTTEDVSPKVRALIHAHIAAEGVEELLSPITISSPDFKKKMEEKGSKKSQAVNVEYAIRDTITQRVAEDPAFYGSLQSRLEKIIDEQRQERRNDAASLKTLLELAEEASHRESLAQSLGLEGKRDFAIFGVLKGFADKTQLSKDQDRASLAKELNGIVDRLSVAEWVERLDIQREMRREIKRLLRGKGFGEDDIAQIAHEIMEISLQWPK